MSKRDHIRTASRTDIERAQSAFGTKAGRPSGGSDLLIPTAFPQPFGEPDVPTIRALMFAYIEEGARRGAFDDGTAAYADQWIFGQLDGWLALIEEKFRVRLDSAAWIVGGRVANVSVASGTIADLQERVDQLDADLARWRGLLLGDEFAQEPVAAAPAGRGTAPLPDGLLTGGQLRGLSLAPEPQPETATETKTDSDGASVPDDPTPLPAIHAVDDTREPATAHAR